MGNIRDDLPVKGEQDKFYCYVDGKLELLTSQEYWDLCKIKSEDIQNYFGSKVQLNNDPHKIAEIRQKALSDTFNTLQNQIPTRAPIDTIDPFKKQVGGSHYAHFAIQPAQYNRKNNLGWYESNVVKYVSRHRFKNKRQDIEKAIHMLECILKEYDDGDLT